MIVVGLDLSLTSCGVAVLGHLASDSQVVDPLLLRSVGEDGEESASYRQRSRRVRRQNATILRTITATVPFEEIDLAVVEGPIYGVKILPSYFDRAGLFHAVYGALDARNIPIAVVPPTTGHQFVTGKGILKLPNGEPDRKKKTVVDETRRWWPYGPHVHNGDQGDALGLSVMGIMHLGLKPPFRPKARHYHAVSTVDWPKS